jgi:ribonucleotide monophosphatase NagD (HAD superfamily)
VPLYLLTNAGSITEKRETEIINSKLNSNFAVENVMLCHTPLGSPEMVDFYKDKVVLTAAPNEHSCGEIAEAYGYKHWISLLEYNCIYPYIGAIALEWSPCFYKY